MKKSTILILTLLAGNIIINSTSTSAQTSVNCNLTLKTTIQTFKVYKHNPSGAILFKAKMAIDADGSPRAYGPNNSGLDYTANAGSSGNWWGVVTNNNGNPIIQGSGDPFPGMYVSTTSLVNTSFPSTKPSHYVNSETVPFFVLPSAVTTLGNIHLGDIGYVYNTVTGQGCYAIFADGGPAGKLGEASIYLASQIGVNSNARTGGTSQGIIDYIVFPNSGSGQGIIPSIAQINAIGAAKINTVGGTGITACLSGTPPPSCGTPSALSASAITSVSVTLNWTVVSGANSYNIQYKPASSSGWTTTTSTTTSKPISGLSASTSYQFQVQAVCSGTGTYSVAASFITSATTSTNTTITVGNGTSAYSAHPFSTIYMDERTQYIITKSELTTAGWSAASPYLKSMAFNVTTAASQPMGSFTITIAHVSGAAFSNTTFLSGTNTTTVYSGTVTAVSGWNTYNFSTPFAYNGTGNLLISICWNNSSFTSNSSVQCFSYSDYVALYYRADLSGSGVCSKSTGTRSYYRPNAKLGFSSTPAGLMPFEGENIGERSMEETSPLSNANESILEIFPNPLDGPILYGKLSNSENKKMVVKIYDMVGREVFSKEIMVEGGNFSIPFDDGTIKTGIYMVVGQTDTNRFTKKLIVKQ